VGRNASAYIVTWDEMLHRFPSFAALDDLHSFLTYSGGHEVVVPEAQSWLTIYPLPWELFVWKAAFCVSENYHALRVTLPRTQQQLADELFGNLFVYWSVDDLPSPSCRYADDLRYFIDQDETDRVISLSPSRIKHLLSLAQQLNWSVFEQAFEPQTPDCYIPDFLAFQDYVQNWLKLLKQTERQFEKGLVITVE